MKKLVLTAMLLTVSSTTVVSEEMRPIEKLSMLGDVYNAICVAYTGAKGNYHAPDKFNGNWHCYKPEYHK